MTPPNIKVEHIRTAIKLTSLNCFMTDLDLKDAYYLVPVHKMSRTYIRFIFNEEIFEFTCLPFGLYLNPYLFPKLMKVFVYYLRSVGWILCIYLEDFLFFGKNYNICLRTRTRCKFLSFTIDSRFLHIKPTHEKKATVVKLIKEFKNKSQCTIREFALVPL